MPIVVRFQSGSLAGRELSFDQAAVRIGDAADAHVVIDPALPDNGGARGRVVELRLEGDALRLLSLGDRELSAQHGEPLDRLVAPGEELRFGAWGPIFTASFVPGAASSPPAPPAAPAAPAASPADAATAPFRIGADDSQARRKLEDSQARKAEESQARRRSLLGTGEKPIGQRTVSMMIQDALVKARESSDATFVEKGTVFVREIVTDTISSATRSLKIGLVLTVAALVVLAAALVYNVQRTRETVSAAEKAVDQGMAGVKRELGGKLDAMKKERDALAAESQGLGQKIGELEKTTGSSQAEVAALKTRLLAAEERRHELEARLARALSAAEADRGALAQKLERIERERVADRERQQAEIEKLRTEQAEKVPPAQPVVPVATPAPTAPQATPAPR